MTNREVSKDLQLIDHDKLTLNEAVSKARQTEQVIRELSEQNHGHSSHVHDDPLKADAVRDSQRQARRDLSRADQHSKEYVPSRRNLAAARRCPWCGSTRDHSSKRSECPAKEKLCHACGKLGHFRSVCRSSNQQAIHNVCSEPQSPQPDQSDGNDSKFLFLGAANQDGERQDSPWTVTLQVSGTPVQFKIDTGADVTVMTRASFNRLLHPPSLSQSTIKLKGAGGEILDVEGEFTAPIEHKGQFYELRAVVIAGSVISNLLSRSMSAQMGLVRQVLSCSG